jgi:hypothetical protein
MRKNAGWLAAAGLLTAALVAPALVSAASVVPTEHEGNTSAELCDDLDGTYIKLDGVTSGTVAGVTVEIVYDADAKTTSFTATGGKVWHAFVKGGNGYNHYDYSGTGGVAADSGLVAPNNESGGPAGLSHIDFCVAEDEVEVTPTPDQSIEGETGTPVTTAKITLPPSDSIGGTSGPSNGAWTILLVALAGLMASALVLTPAARKIRR